MMPHPGLPGPPVTASASLLGLAGAAGSASHPLSMLGAKPTDMHRGADSDKPSSAIGKCLLCQHLSPSSLNHELIIAAIVYILLRRPVRGFVCSHYEIQ